MSLRTDVQEALNRNSAENVSGTPDFVLANFLEKSLEAFDTATNLRDKWWGFDPKIGGVIPAKGDL